MTVGENHTMTEQLYLADATIGSCSATVVAFRPGPDGAPQLRLDRTVMYATGGGQPHDVGTIGASDVIDVIHDSEDHDVIWHTLAPGAPAPGVGDAVEVRLDVGRRQALMRTHTAMHILCGVMWRDHGVVVTGGNMEPLSGRLDFEFPEPPEGFAQTLEAALNAEVVADREISVSFLERDAALLDDSLIRTKVNLVPESVRQVRVVDIAGLDRQADGGTHVSADWGSWWTRSRQGAVEGQGVSPSAPGCRRLTANLSPARGAGQVTCRFLSRP